MSLSNLVSPFYQVLLTLDSYVEKSIYEWFQANLKNTIRQQGAVFGCLFNVSGIPPYYCKRLVKKLIDEGYHDKPVLGRRFVHFETTELTESTQQYQYIHIQWGMSTDAVFQNGGTNKTCTIQKSDIQAFLTKPEIKKYSYISFATKKGEALFCNVAGPFPIPEEMIPLIDTTVQITLYEMPFQIRVWNNDHYRSILMDGFNICDDNFQKVQPLADYICYWNCNAESKRQKESKKQKVAVDVPVTTAASASASISFNNGAHSVSTLCEIQKESNEEMQKEMQKESMKDKVENTIVKTVDTILATMSNPESKSAAISQIIREAANDIATMMLV